MVKNPKTESNAMSNENAEMDTEFNPIRCANHTSGLSLAIESIKNIFTILRGDGNGDSGIMNRVKELEREHIKREAKEKIKSSAVRVFVIAVGVQFSIVLYNDLLKPLYKHLIGQ